MNALSETDIQRLDAVLISTLHDPMTHVGPAEARDLRNLVLEPTRARWNALYDLALDAASTISLWQAVCNVSSFTTVVPIDRNQNRAWPADIPTSLEILSALEYARA